MVVRQNLGSCGIKGGGETAHTYMSGRKRQRSNKNGIYGSGQESAG